MKPLAAETTRKSKIGEPEKEWIRATMEVMALAAIGAPPPGFAPFTFTFPASTLIMLLALFVTKSLPAPSTMALGQKSTSSMLLNRIELKPATGALTEVPATTAIS
ncbi:MAG: hypothetical protein BWZ10_02117 [candidate division BRC1 bacterium ADurb.BinA364]|nr:MAG: hypothetical protein BWZ10_02117 [candidate division BRC1 bacterium ADurb.BinA364]